MRWNFRNYMDTVFLLFIYLVITILLPEAFIPSTVE